MVHRVLAVIVVAALFAGCAGPAASGVATHGSSQPAGTGASGPTATPGATPAQQPTVIPGLVDVVDIEGSVILGRNEAGETVLFDLADGSTIVLEAGLQAMPMDLGERFAVGMGPRGPFVYDRPLARLIDAAIDEDAEGTSFAVDGTLMVGARRDTSDPRVFTWDVETGKVERFDFLDGQARASVAAVSRGRMAGTFGDFDVEHAWTYDIATDTYTDLEPILPGHLSWASDVDGSVVVGGTEAPRPFDQHAYLYDAESGLVTDLRPVFGQDCRAEGIDGNLVVGTVGEYDGPRSAFVYDRSTGVATVLPSQGNASARAISGRRVAGYVGSSVVVWDLASMP